MIGSGRMLPRTDDGREEADVGFSELVADEVLLALEDLFNPVEGLEQRHDRGFVSGLRCRKA